MAWGRDVLTTGGPLIVNDYAYGTTLYGEERRFDIRVTKVNHSLSWTWRDVTERYRAAHRLRESEEKYRLLAQNSSDVVIWSDEKGKVLWISPSVSKALGWETRDWIGRRCTEFLAEKSDATDHERLCDGVSKNGTMEVIRQRMLSKDGSIHWVEAHVGPYVTPEGHTNGVVSSFRTIDKQVAAEEELVRRARMDELTKLLNRREALEQIEKLRGQSQRTGVALTVLFVDFDKFKSINDTHGHAAGDAVLQAIADRIRSCLRTSDDIGARVGGDEMLVVLHGVHGLDDAVAVAEKLRQHAMEPIAVAGKTIATTVSIGVTLATTHEKTHALIARADDAMYQAKAKGRNQVITIPDAGLPAVMPTAPPKADFPET